MDGPEPPAELVYEPVDNGWSVTATYEQPAHTLHWPTPSHGRPGAVRTRTVRDTALRLATRLRHPT
ncbi:MAG: hypothetical protein Kow0092_27370 [Deferrisomatales bacterium]